MDADAARSRELAAALVRVPGGDRAALRLVYRETSAKLFGVCLGILKDRSEAEDVLQDVYVTVWRKAASFDPGRASPITWMVAIARNRSIARLRSRAAGRAPAARAGGVRAPGADRGSRRCQRSGPGRARTRRTGAAAATPRPLSRGAGRAARDCHSRRVSRRLHLRAMGGAG